MHIYVYKCVRVFVYLFVCENFYRHEYIYIYICIYIHIYIWALIVGSVLL